MSDIHQDIEPHAVAFGQIYQGIAKSSPSRLQGGIDVMIPDINPDIEFQNVRPHVTEDDFRPRVGDEVLVIFDNNNQPWIISWAPGIPVGGTAQQVLFKNTATDYDASWRKIAQADLPANLQAQASQVTDANTAVSDGWYFIPGGVGATNGPDASRYWHLLVQNISGTQIRQTAYAIGAEDTRVRRMDSSTWGSWYLPTPKVTTSLFSGGPPASPSDGDQWVARNVLTNNGGTYVNWEFSYDASFSVWRFIGGTPVNASTTAFVFNGVTNAWAAQNPSWTAVRSGQYLCTFSGRAVLNGAAITESFWLAIAFNGPGVTSTGIYHGGIFQTTQASLGVTARGVGGVSAGQVISAGFYVTNTLIGLLGEIHITPIYVT